MDSVERTALEDRIRALCQGGDKRRGATLLLEGYGRELLGFLIAHLRDDDAAAEVFAQFTEDLWRGLDGFRWQCPARVWSYTLLRHAASRYSKDARRRRGRQVPLSRAGPLSEIQQKVRTETLAALRSESRNRMTELRERLPVDEQTLIILRVNRKMTWKEIAQVMLYEGNAGTVTPDEILAKEAVRLRKRYQLAKGKLRQMAVDQGLVGSDPDG